jgi:hypothetical protein
MKKLNKKGRFAMKVSGWGGLYLFLDGMGAIESGKFSFSVSLLVALIGILCLAFAAKLSEINSSDIN